MYIQFFYLIYRYYRDTWRLSHVTVAIDFHLFFSSFFEKPIYIYRIYCVWSITYVTLRKCTVIAVYLWLLLHCQTRIKQDSGNNRRIEFLSDMIIYICTYYYIMFRWLTRILFYLHLCHWILNKLNNRR